MAMVAALRRLALLGCLAGPTAAFHSHRAALHPHRRALARPQPQPQTLSPLGMVDAPFVEECTYVDRTDRDTPKERVVVLGAGWAAVKFLQNVDTSRYAVTVVSPRNFFLFTPFLPSCVVGTVEARSIVEPIRKLLRYDARPLLRQARDRLARNITRDTYEEATFLEAACTKIDAAQSCVFCQDVSAVAGPCDAFRLDYDKLVVAVGATSNTFDVSCLAGVLGRRGTAPGRGFETHAQGVCGAWRRAMPAPPPTPPLLLAKLALLTSCRTASVTEFGGRRFCRRGRPVARSAVAMVLSCVVRSAVVRSADVSLGD